MFTCLFKDPKKGVVRLDNRPNMTEPKGDKKEDSKKKIKAKSEQDDEKQWHQTNVFGVAPK